MSNCEYLSGSYSRGGSNSGSGSNSSSVALVINVEERIEEGKEKKE